MKVKRFTLIGIACTIAGVAVSLGSSGWIVGAKPAVAQVEVRQEGTIVGTQAPSDALKEASGKVGFEVLPLASLPSPSLVLKFVDGHTGPSGVATALKYAVVGYESMPDGPKVAVSEFNVRMIHPANDASERVDLGMPGVEAWKSAGESVTVYTLLTATRTYDLVVTGMPEFSNADLARLATSLK